MISRIKHRKKQLFRTFFNDYNDSVSHYDKLLIMPIAKTPFCALTKLKKNLINTVLMLTNRITHN